MLFRRAFWLNLGGACVVAIVAAVPILMSTVMQRGFDIPKQSLAAPLAVLACAATGLAVGWSWILRQSGATRVAAGALTGFLILAAVSTALSEHPAIAVFGGSYRREGLLAWAVYGAFFFAVLGWAYRAGRVQSFLDAIMLSSVIASGYALQQRVNLDFYPLGMRDFTRPGGTLGSPVFLAAYLASLLPLTVTRCWRVRRVMSELAPWLAVAALQVCGMLVTQSRGPLLAAIAGMLLLAGCYAGRAHARRAFVSAFAVFALVVASIVVINTLAAARHWASDVPVLSRLIFDLDREAGDQIWRASRSAAARLAIWSAGAETFAAAPLANKLLGFGPDSASSYFFPYMPAAIMRLLGYGHDKMIDRLHADTFDVGLNFGLLAWLAYALFFSAVIYAAAQALWGLSGRAPPWVFAAAGFGGGALSSAAALLAGLGAAAVPAFGLGVGAGWFFFMIGCAWRELERDIPAVSAKQTQNWAVLAGLISSLWIFWTDAQVNIPVPTTRFISFAVAALILIVASGMLRGAESRTESGVVSGASLRAWGVCCSLVAACASWLPVVLFATSTGAAELYWWRRALPVLPFLFIAAPIARAYWRNSKGGGGISGSALLTVAVGLPLVYIAAHLALIATSRSESTIDDAWSISFISSIGTLFVLAMCIVFAWIGSRHASRLTYPLTLSRTATWAAGAAIIATLLVAAMDWRARKADVASTLAVQVYGRRPQLSEQLIEEAIRLQPHERQYRRQLVFDLLQRALTTMQELEDESKPPADAADRVRSVVRNLAGAEAAARDAVMLFPHDPWVVIALANVLQIKALRVLRPLDPDASIRAAQEANDLFGRAHTMFPAEPALLRNWAELMADQGDLAAAYRLLDLMEKLIPNELEPYAARLKVAKQVSDIKTISDTMARARSALAAREFSVLVNVANLQRH